MYRHLTPQLWQVFILHLCLWACDSGCGSWSSGSFGMIIPTFDKNHESYAFCNLGHSQKLLLLSPKVIRYFSGRLVLWAPLWWMQPDVMKTLYNSSPVLRFRFVSFQISYAMRQYTHEPAPFCSVPFPFCSVFAYDLSNDWWNLSALLRSLWRSRKLSKFWCW